MAFISSEPKQLPCKWMKIKWTFYIYTFLTTRVCHGRASLSSSLKGRLQSTEDSWAPTYWTGDAVSPLRAGCVFDKGSALTHRRDRRDEVPQTGSRVSPCRRGWRWASPRQIRWGAGGLVRPYRTKKDELWFGGKTAKRARELGPEASCMHTIVLFRFYSFLFSTNFGLYSYHDF